MMKKGEVLSAEVLPAFAREVERAFGVENIDSVDNFNSSVGKLSSSWDRFIANITDGNSIFQAVIGFLIRQLNTVVDAFNLVASTSKERALLQVGGKEQERRDVFEEATLRSSGLGPKIKEQSDLIKKLADERQTLLDEGYTIESKNIKKLDKQIAESAKKRADFEKQLADYRQKEALSRVDDKKQEAIDAEKRFKEAEEKVKEYEQKETAYFTGAGEDRKIDIQTNTEQVKKDLDELKKARADAFREYVLIQSDYNYYKKFAEQGRPVAPLDSGDGSGRGYASRPRAIKFFYDKYGDDIAKLNGELADLEERNKEAFLTDEEYEKIAKRNFRT